MGSRDWEVAFVVRFALLLLMRPGMLAMEIPQDVPQPPTIIKQSVKDHIVEPRDPVVIECEATGNPQPAFTWTRDGKYLNVARDSQVTMRRRSGTLEIFFYGKPEDYEGEYQCTATNEYGSAVSSNINLRISKARSWPKEHQEPLTVFVGEPLVLQCNPPPGPPEPTTYWVNSSMVPIKQSRRVSKAENGDLYFAYVLPEDANTDYCCTARFPYSYTIHQKSAVILQVLTVRRPSEKAPAFMYPPKKATSKTVLVGEEFVVECFATGVPPPVMKWTKDWGEVSLDGKRLESFNKRIRILSATAEDAGDYTCTASNKMGYVERTIHVTVKGAPFWLEKPKNLILSRDASGRMTCQADGIPRPTIQWLINGMPVDEAEPVPGRQVSGETLSFKGVTEATTAVYQCNASNPYGYLLANAFISVMDQQARILGPRDQLVKVIEGRKTALDCPYFGAPAPELNWSKGGVGKLEGGRYKVYKNGTLEIRKTRLDDHGTYMCIVSNIIGRDENQVTLEVKEPTQVFQKPQNVVILRGGDAKFECAVKHDESMMPSVHWEKNNKTLYIGRRMIKEEESLTILNVNKADEGLYSCVVKTELDDIIVSARLKVMDRPDAPTDLEISEPSERSVRLTWKPGDSNHSPIKEYLVQVKEEWWFPSAWSNLTSYPGNLNSVVLQLSPYLSYRFRIIAVNGIGQSQPSRATDYYQTGGAVPDAYPKNIKGVGSGLWRNNMEITWEPLPERDWNGPYLQYMVWWKRRESKEEWKNVTTRWWWHTIYDTDTFTAYEIKVQAINSFGYGPESPVVIGYSGEDRPLEAPLELSVFDIESTSATVTWQPVVASSIMGELKEYKVYFWRESSQLPWLSVSRRTKSKGFGSSSGERLSGEVTGLIPYSNYRMYIVVANNRYEGPASATIEFQTPEGVPSAPRSFKIQHRHLDTIYVEWERPAEPNGIITGYILRYQQLNASRGEKIREEQFTPNHTYFSVQRYDRYTRYKFSVAAQTEVGIGEFYTEESPHFTEAYSTDQVDLATQGWFIGLMCAIALLVIIMLVVFFIKRSRGGKYPVRDKKDFSLEPLDDKDQEGTFDYRSLERITRVPTLPYTRREEDMRQLHASRRRDSDDMIRRTESDDSLVEYGNGGAIDFNEDGSFIGQYTGVSKHERSDKSEYHDSSEATSPTNTMYTLA